MDLSLLKAVIVGPVTAKLNLTLVEQRRGRSAVLLGVCVLCVLCAPLVLLGARVDSIMYHTVFVEGGGLMHVPRPTFWQAGLRALGLVIGPYVAWALALYSAHWLIARKHRPARTTPWRFAFAFSLAYWLIWAVHASMRCIYQQGLGLGVACNLRAHWRYWYAGWHYFTHVGEVLLVITGGVLLLFGLLSHVRVLARLSADRAARSGEAGVTSAA